MMKTHPAAHRVMGHKFPELFASRRVWRTGKKPHAGSRVPQEGPGLPDGVRDDGRRQERTVMLQIAQAYMKLADYVIARRDRGTADPADGDQGRPS
jgi:hypothetical protein